MELRLGIDVACRAEHQVSCADQAGNLLFSGRRLRTTVTDLDRLWASLPDHDRVLVVLEPTRNAWVPLAAWFAARGARVALVPAEQAADLRDYYHKHTKNDRLDSRLLARLPLLHPDGLRVLDAGELGPADPLRRAARRHRSLVKRRTATYQRIEALLELLGPDWEVLGAGDYGKAALAVLEHTGAHPRVLRRIGQRRLTSLLIKASRGQWRDDKATAILAAARASEALWAGGGLDFDELARDIAAEAGLASHLSRELDTVDARLAELYHRADPEQIIASAPGLAAVSAGIILGGLGNPDRFATLTGVRAFTGLVPSIDQSGTSARHGPPTKAGDPMLREALFEPPQV